MPFKVQINYRYPDEGVEKAPLVIAKHFNRVKDEVDEVLQWLADKDIQKVCIIIEYIPLKKED